MSSPLPASRTGRIGRPDGATIVYEITGSGPALLFAHGLGGNHLSWWQQLPVFARAHTCIAFSHRGFSPSTSPEGAPDPRDYAADAAALLDHLEIDRVVHVGQSMGGWTGVELALRHPERLAGLVLACTTGSLDFDRFDDPAIVAWRERAPRMVAEMDARGIHRATGEVFARTEPALHNLYGMIDRLNAGLDKEAVRRRIWEMRSRGPEDAARIACPVLCITGEDDAVIAPAGVRAVARHIPDATVVGIPATGHSVYFERADLFNAVLAEFLERIGWR
ncbi:alpha/beta fold hydrolase [Salinarimonas ramus]|uniref:Alpha/beta hydrolase n=1 Tax=Salinarimonas ramus TaxID=690164 RepID=A0A917QF57_9HYPH|nr:alpha/beta hydrolase [Salinarimonas ramus]GGK45954.1 alpha/beta hydrolase [Salinarimonas ramus]